MLFLILILLFIGLIWYISRQPDTFRIVREKVIAAPAADIFPHINNLHRWEHWSPWAKLDPDAVNTFEGPEEGVGASMAWNGNNKVGQGRMTITESEHNRHIGIRMDFLKPMQATSQVDFMLTPDGDGTRVTWSMSGINNFMGKAVSLIMNCDKMVGGYYEKGLENLERVVKA